MIRSAKIIFCDNEHGTGDVTFPSLDRTVQQLQGEYVAPQTVGQLRKAAKKEGWTRIDGGDYCPQCSEVDELKPIPNSNFRERLKRDGASETDLSLAYRKVFVGIQFAVGLYGYNSGAYEGNRYIVSERQQVGFEIWSEDDEVWSFHATSASIHWAEDLISVLKEANVWVEKNCETVGAGPKVFKIKHRGR